MSESPEDDWLSKQLDPYDVLYMLPALGTTVQLDSVHSNVDFKPLDILNDDPFRIRAVVYATDVIPEFDTLRMHKPTMKCPMRDGADSVARVSNPMLSYAGTQGAKTSNSITARSLLPVKHVGTLNTYFANMKISLACGFERYNAALPLGKKGAEAKRNQDACVSIKRLFPISLVLAVAETRTQ